MKSHTWLGARQFQDESELSFIAQQVALHHHENWDGTGYPGRVGDLFEADKYIENGMECPPGLVGEEIPIFARIVAIADVYDALSSARAYKPEWKESEVVASIRENAGRKFDPELVDVFLDVLPMLRNIRKRFPDPD